jgi:large subunit ribosomal protein L29
MKEMSNDDLAKRLSELRLELAKEKSQIAIGGSASNPGRIKETKKTIARILTETKRRGEKTV